MRNRKDLYSFDSRFIETSLLLLLLNQMLLSCTCNITRTMRSVTEYYKKCWTILTRSIYGITSLEYLESNMKLNELNEKEIEAFSQKQTSRSKFKTSQKELNVL